MDDKYHNNNNNNNNIIEPDLEYLEKLKVLDLPTRSDFINTASESVFKKIARNEKHPPFNRIAVNQPRISSRLNTVYRPPKCRTQKRFNSFSHSTCLILTNKLFSLGFFSTAIYFYHMLIHNK